MSSIRILIIDDHAMVRQGLRLALQLQSDFEIIGEAKDGFEGLDFVKRLQPDVILLDLNMPKMNGIEMTKKLQDKSGRSRILMLSGVQADARIFEAIEAGVDGYIVKDATTEELTTAIRHIASGDSYFHPIITQALLRFSQAGPASNRSNRILSTRELSVLQLMATSATNLDIAKQLFISEETVRTHVKNILRKLNKTNRTQAVLDGVRRGLIDLE